MQDTLFTSHGFWPSTATFMEEMCFVISFLSVSLWIRLCVSLGEFIFPVSLFIARRTSSELVMSEEQGLALTAWGTVAALG